MLLHVSASNVGRLTVGIRAAAPDQRSCVLNGVSLVSLLFVPAAEGRQEQAGEPDADAAAQLVWVG